MYTWLRSRGGQAKGTLGPADHAGPGERRPRRQPPSALPRLTAGRSSPRAAAGVHSSSVVLLSRNECSALIGSVPSGSRTVSDGRVRAGGCGKGGCWAACARVLKTGASGVLRHPLAAGGPARKPQKWAPAQNRNSSGKADLPEILWSPQSTVRSGSDSCRACASLAANTITRAGASSGLCLRAWKRVRCSACSPCPATLCELASAAWSLG